MVSFFSSLLKNKTLVNSAIYMAGSVLSRALAFLVLPIFTRYLTPDDYGILSYTGSIMTFLLMLSTLSLNSFVLRHYFEIQPEKQRQELFGTIFLFLLAFNIIIVGIAFLVFPYVLKWLHVQIPFHPYFEIALVINFLEIFPIIPEVYFRVTRKAWQYFLLTSSRAILAMMVGLFLVIRHDMGVMGRYYGSLYTNLLFVIICSSIIFKMSRLSFNIVTIRKGLRFSLPLLPAAVGLIAIISSDKVILERYVPLSQLGIYAVGVTLGALMSIIVRGFYFAVEPEVYESFNHEGFEQKILRLKNRFLCILICIGCIIIVFSREIVMIIASENFYDSYKIIPFFVIGTIFRGAELLVGRTLFALNKTLYQPVIIGIALLLNIVGNFVFIPFMGIFGAALASALSFVIWFWGSVYVTRKFLNIRWHCMRDTFLIAVVCGLSILIMKIQVEVLFLTVLIKTVILLCIALMTFYGFVKHKVKLPV